MRELEANRALQRRLEDLVRSVDRCAYELGERRRKVLARIATEGVSWRVGGNRAWSRWLERGVPAVLESEVYVEALPAAGVPSAVREIHEPSHVWTDKEGARLGMFELPEGVEEEEVDWDEVAIQYASSERRGVYACRRSGLDCKLAWKNLWGPHINKRPWTAEERATLKSIAGKRRERDWEATASELGTRRSALQCLMEYQRTVRPNMSDKPWSELEDETLSESVRMHGTKNWMNVASMLPGRAARECQIRFKKKVKAKRGRWNPEEEYRLMLAYSACLEKKEHKTAAEGDVKRCNWQDIARYVPNRNDVQCREKWCNSTMNPEARPDPWTPEEDKQLADFVEQYGRNYSKIAPLMTARTTKQVKVRWMELEATGKKKKKG